MSTDRIKAKQRDSLRVCLVSKEYPPEGKGGIANYVHLLAHGFAKQGHDVTVIAGPAQNGSMALRSSQVSANGPKVSRIVNRRLPLPPPIRRKARGIWNQLERSWAVDGEIARLEREQGPFDVVEMPNWGAEGLCYALHPRAPLVIRLATPLAQVDIFKGGRAARPGLRLACFLEALPARRSARLIANSEYIAKLCGELYRIPKKETDVIPQGISMPNSPPETKYAKKDLVTILFVGRLERRKGIDQLLHAIPKVIDVAPRCRFIIAGADMGEAPQGHSYQSYFESFAADAARGATTFLGYVEDDDLQRLYANCDIFVAPSLSESFGRIYLEAMARAKPVVAFQTAAVPEVVEQNGSGILVEPGSAAELARALIKLAKSPDLRQRMGKSAYERVRTNFTAERMLADTLSCYRQVMAQVGYVRDAGAA